jgi:hypothetical protein
MPLAYPLTIGNLPRAAVRAVEEETDMLTTIAAMLAATTMQTPDDFMARCMEATGPESPMDCACLTEKVSADPELMAEFLAMESAEDMEAASDAAKAAVADCSGE